MKMYILGMTCPHCCPWEVEETLKKIGASYKSVKMGEVELEKELTPEQVKEFINESKKVGHVLKMDKKGNVIYKD